MFGFELNDVDPHDSMPRPVFKTLARENLPNLSTIMRQRVEEVFARISGEGEGAMKEGDEPVISAFDLSKSLIARMNNQLLFGDELGTSIPFTSGTARNGEGANKNTASNDEFEEQSVRYAWHTIIVMQILRQIPSLFVPFVAKIFLRWSGSMHYVGSRVQDLVNERLSKRTHERNEKARLDGTEWVISASSTPAQLSPQRLVQQMIALLFASMHQMQMATCWALIDLCAHQEHIPTLRKEIHDVFSSGCVNPYNKLRFMDAFLRESSRLNPLDGLTTQRKAMRDFYFSNGAGMVPKGNLVAIPQKVVMRDPERYENPEAFDPYRWMGQGGEEEANTMFTDVNWNFTFWGSPRKAW